VFVLPEDFSVTEQVGLVEAAEQKPAFNRSTKTMSAIAISNEEKPELMKGCICQEHHWIHRIIFVFFCDLWGCRYEGLINMYVWSLVLSWD
jgi:hypothetical protein